MRPKLIAIVAVSALALVGCSAGEPGAGPAKPVVQPTKSAPGGPPLAPEAGDTPPVPATGKAEEPLTDPDKEVEEQFADFAELRAEMNAAKKPDRNKVINGLNEFCESGKPFDISETQDLNTNLDFVADSTYCEMLASN